MQSYKNVPELLFLSFIFLLMRLTFSFLFFSALFIIVSCSNTEQQKGDNKYVVYSCGAENIDTKKNKFSEDSLKNLYFQNPETQSADVSHSGKYSVKLFPGRPYALTTEIKNIAPDDYIKITVWRKTTGENGVIVLDGGEGYYFANKKIVEKGDRGWNKIFMEYHVPPNFYAGKMKFYLWSNSNDTVYFDDLKIVVRNRKVYPEYKSKGGLQIYTDEANLVRFNKKRLEAFESTVLVNSDEDYSKMVLYDGKDFLNGTFRLKGDLVDHLQGQKWSFRIKLKKGFAWRNMRTFSIQNPATRDFLSEWLAHKLFKQEDVLTTRYGFIPVKMNNRSLGIYAYEEHFEKQLIESNNRREGPIIRFDEDLFWQRVLETKKTKREWDVDFLGAAKIIPFKSGRTVADTTLYDEFLEAQNLLLQYKTRGNSLSKIFDTDKLAKYYAIIDLTQSYHGFAWHNQRFYYNPVTCLLEPIAFDGYIETGVFQRIEEPVNGLLNPGKVQGLSHEELILFQVFADSVFNKNYIKYLKELSSDEFVNSVVAEYKNSADSLSLLIREEFPYYQFHFDRLIKQATFIRNNIDNIETNIEKLQAAIIAVHNKKFGREYTTDVNRSLIKFQVQGYFNRTKKQLEVLNFSNTPVKILGAFIAGQLPASFEPRPEIAPYNGETPSRITVPLSGEPLTLLFSIGNQMYESEINNWPAPGGLSSRQKVLAKNTIADLPIVNNRVVFDGKYRFDRDVIIDKKMRVEFKPGTEINLINGAGFFSFVAVQMNGTEKDPIKIFSTDNSGNGFNVLQTDGVSKLKHVQFSGLSSLKRGGWQTPAAVTFYEAAVEFENCTFAENFNCDDALNVVRSKVTATNCLFENTFADAFDSDFSTGEVTGCTFRNIGNDAIDFSGSQMEITNCKMMDITDKAISGGENSQLTVMNCEINNANIGVASKDLSTVKLNKIEMTNTVYGFVAFIKKPEYGPAKIEIDNLKMKKNKVFHQIEEGSVFILNGKTFFGKEKKLAEKLYQ